MSELDPMDTWLREAMAAPEPRLSPPFEAELTRRLRERHLDRSGRLVMAGYVVIATAVTMWALSGVPFELLLWLLPMAGLAGSLSVYASRLVRVL